MRIYFDVCCYCRPFDDQSQLSICVETSAIVALLSQCYCDSWTVFGSSVIEAEILRNPEVNLRNEIFLSYYATVNEIIPYNTTIQTRAVDVQKYGLKHIDSLHFASAEIAMADILFTVDKDFIKFAKKIDSSMPVENPVDWILKRNKTL